MKWLLSTYTIRFNRRHKVFGHLFSGRYKALPVDGSASGYLRTACDYVHLNPVRAKWLRVSRVLGECGIPKDSTAGRRQFAQRMESRRAGDESEFQALERGW